MNNRDIANEWFQFAVLDLGAANFLADMRPVPLEIIFHLLPRIAVASLIAYLLSQMHDIWAFALWKKLFPGEKQLWIRNNLSTMVSQLIDSVIFCVIAFLGVFEAEVFWSILLTTYFLKWIVAAADTPFVYLAKAIHLKKIKDTGNN